MTRIILSFKKTIKRLLRGPTKFARRVVKSLLRDCIEEIKRSVTKETNKQIADCIEEIKQSVTKETNKQIVDCIEEIKRSVTRETNKQIEHWARVTNKQIERWTWDRFKRTQEEIYGILFDLDREKMQQAITYSPTYDLAFYLNNRFGSISSAQRVLSIVLKWFPHESIVDFGCGTGTWLWVAQAFGAREILGIDGDYVPRPLLIIPEKCFMPADLECRIILGRRYDIAMSLEVAEHLSPESATYFVDSLCESSDIVLFSAAHPGQGGDGHINERPMEYWIEKFATRNYMSIEIRHFFQQDEKIKSWYRENLVLFVHKSCHTKFSTIINNQDFKIHN